MQIQENFSLKAYNTFGIDASAKSFSLFKNSDELAELLNASRDDRRLILGGGSNILFTKDYDGIVLKNEIKGIEIIREDGEFIYIKAGAGENWHQFVLYCIGKNWGGVENLSLIPGNTGASPMQNIGAYGVEIKEVFYELNAYHLYDKAIQTFSLKDCEFGYRESIFKRRYKDKFVILSVTYKLRKVPVFHIQYGAIAQELERMGVKELDIRSISQAIINIRTSKLPDPREIGNAGSFFKNPSVPKEKYDQLKSRHPAMVGYENADGTIKLAAGWLIEDCGWKGFREGDAGVHAKQALVLVNYQNASGREILDLSERVIETVNKKFGVVLEREVNIV